MKNEPRTKSWRPQWYPDKAFEKPIKVYLAEHGWTMQDLFNNAVGEHLKKHNVKVCIKP